MEFVYFSNARPRVDFGCERPGVYLIFDCVPSQYREVCEWICTKWDQKCPLFRFVIPCHRTRHDITDILNYEEEFPADNLKGFTGYFDYWPSHAIYKVAEIIVGDLGDFTASSLYRNGHQVEPKYLRPQFKSGLSILQERALDLIENHQLTSLGALCYELSCEYHLPVDTCEGSILEITGSSLVVPEAPKLLADRSTLLEEGEGEEQETESTAGDCAYPLLEIRGRRIHRITSNRLYSCLPYVPSVSPRDMVKRIDIIKGKYSGPREDYINEWIQGYLMASCEDRPRTLRYLYAKQDFLRRLIIGSKREIRTNDMYIERRWFIDEPTLAEKRKELLKLYDTDLVDSLMAIPLKELGPECIHLTKQEEKRQVTGPCWNARDEWQTQLKTVAV